MKINIILPTYENTNLTLNCLKSIKENLDENFDVNIIWVDNNSSIESRTEILDYLKLNLSYDNIFLGKNLGFIKAVNIALKYVLEKYQRNKYVAIINNDIEVSKNWIKNLIDCFKNDEKIVLAGAMSYNYNTINETELIECPELRKVNKDTFSKSIKYLEKYKFEDKIYSFEDFKSYDFLNTYVAYYCVIFKQKIFNEIGFLDEKFNLGYGDDTEFNFRITEAGYKIVKSKNTLVFHNSCSTFNQIFKSYEIPFIQESNRLQLRISKTLNCDKSKKYVIYTCISGNYDNLLELSMIDTENFDYVAFTNLPVDHFKNTSCWKVINISDFNIGIDKDDPDYLVKFARFIKLHPHLFFENYEKSIWIDGNINVIGEMKNFVNFLTDDEYLLTSIHPYRNDIYEEIIACSNFKKDTVSNLNKINKFLVNENFPRNTQLVQSGILLRNHKNKECIFLMEKWWEMIKNYTKRDQLSFNYIFWKYGGRYLGIPWDILSKTYVKTNYQHGGK